MDAMPIIGFIAGNWWLWLIGAILFGIIFFAILAKKGKQAYDKMKNDPFGVLAETAETILEDPEAAARKAAKPAGKTIGMLIIAKVLVAVFGGLFSLSVVINVALFIISRFWPQT